MSKTGSAQMDTGQMEMLPQQHEAESPLKKVVAERLAAHRAKMQKGRVEQVETPAPVKTRTARQERARQAVAKRYAQSQSYREFLAAEAERAVHEAQAAAEVATRSAEAVVRAQQELLHELDQWRAAPEDATQMDLASSLQETSAEDAVSVTGVEVQKDAEAAEEFAVPANVIEFPLLPGEKAAAAAQVVADRIEQIVASQAVAASLQKAQAAPAAKAREIEVEADEQLQIFEVDPTQRLSAPPATQHISWTPLILDARPLPREEAQGSFAMLPQTASLELRMMAGLVDGCIVGFAALGFVAVAGLEMHTLPRGTMAAGTCTVMVAMLLALYQTLFFTFSVATPGMLYARIGLCTFNDENPTRSAMWKRSLIMMLSAAPLGLGFLWAWLDEDGLGWHDRITRIYQRSY